MGPVVTTWAFVATALVGGVLGAILAARSGNPVRHWLRLRAIAHEIVAVRDPVRLSEIAAARKPTMLLLPYGIPMAIGSIGYFAWARLLF